MSSSKNTPAARARRVQHNEGRKCKAEGCTKPRYKFGGYCRNHSMRVHIHGHPYGRRIKPDLYQGERQEVHEFLERHAKLQHPAVVAALSFFEKWLREGAEGVNVPARADMHRLYTAGVVAMDALVETAAVWLLSRRRPGLLPDGLALTYALGTNLLSLRPRIYFEVWRNGKREMRPERHKGPTRRLVGKVIRDTLGLFFMHVEAALEREHTERVKQTIAIRTPFTDQPEAQQKET